MVEGGFDCTHVTIDQMPLFNETSKSLLEKQVRQNLIILHFLATLVALHFTPVSKSLSKSLSGQSFELA